MKDLKVLNKLPKSITVEYIADVGFLSYSPSKQSCLYDLKCEIENELYHLFYEHKDNRYKLYFKGKNLKYLVKKMQLKLKNTSFKITKEEWKNAVDYAKHDGRYVG